jgi:hypothetical protein
MSTEGRRSLSLRTPQSTKSRFALRTQVKSLAAKTAMWWPNIQILESLPMFAPNSAGAVNERAALTIQAASQTVPLMIELLGRTGTLIKDPTPITAFVDTAEKRTAALELKKLFDQYGSDKGNSNHNYHWLYGSILGTRRASALLEIGLGTNNEDVVSNMTRHGTPGASLRAFRDFLPDAHIYGADIDRAILFQEERVSTFFVDQTDIDSFMELSAAVPDELDLIIDDGLHTPNANLASLVFGLGRLKIDGYFLVEDIGRAAVPIWQLVSAALLPEQYESHVVEADTQFLFVVRRVK